MFLRSLTNLWRERTCPGACGQASSKSAIPEDQLTMNVQNFQDLDLSLKTASTCFGVGVETKPGASMAATLLGVTSAVVNGAANGWDGEPRGSG
jgi:hypothetical protein